MRKLRPGVARAWRRIQFWQRVNAAFKKALPGIMENFYADSPFQVLLRQKRALAEMRKP
jgi:hypothetical protein